MFSPGTRVHVVGVGGAGMSGLARLLAEHGCVVSGSDERPSDTLDALRAAGLTIFVGRVPDVAADAEIVVWSPAVPLDHPELVAARDAGSQLVDRAHVFQALGDTFRIVGLTGTHGKTTATSMMAAIYAAAGNDVGRLLGAAVTGVGENGHAGTTGELLLEVDESYGTFAFITPDALGLLNVEADHLDHYGSLANLEASFGALAQRTRTPVVAWCDDAGVQRVMHGSDVPWITVGRRADAQWRVCDEVLGRDGASFVLRGPQELPISLRVTGAHNVANAAVVAVLAHARGLADHDIAAGLASFQGAPRRFTHRGRWRGMDIIEDYAHLPGEIAATIACARAVGYQRVACVFQPHRVTRTLTVGEAFAPAFDDADTVLVMDIYTSGEPNPLGVTGDVVAQSLRTRRAGVAYTATFVDVARRLNDVAADVLLLLGAGDVATVLDVLDMTEGDVA